MPREIPMAIQHALQINVCLRVKYSIVADILQYLYLRNKVVLSEVKLYNQVYRSDFGKIKRIFAFGFKAKRGDFMSDYITTYSGTHFFPAKPDRKDFHIRDAAHALSLICRGNGQVKSFFSVGQHCINCAREAKARGYSARVALACLLHDAGEAYLSDVPSPFKKYLKDYVALEERLISMIYEKYLDSDVTEEEQEKIKEIDRDFLAYDLYYLLGEGSREELPEMKIDFSYEFRPFGEVEQEYLGLFYRLREELKSLWE